MTTEKKLIEAAKNVVIACAYSGGYCRPHLINKLAKAIFAAEGKKT